MIYPDCLLKYQIQNSFGSNFECLCSMMKSLQEEIAQMKRNPLLKRPTIVFDSK